VNDPFEILGVEPRFELDLANVETRHRELSRVLHPDRHVGAPPNERRVALSRAIEVNQAFQVLRDPVRRAEALLKQRGLTTEEGREAPPDPLLLMELLELGETIGSARRARDLTQVERIREALSAREQTALEGLGVAFRELESDAARSEQVQKLIGILRFTRRLKSEAENALEELDA
jgi:molecular chaperone HscB